MKLYYMAGACSLVPHTALEWTGVAYDAEAMKLADTKTPEYLALNPQGQFLYWLMVSLCCRKMWRF